MRRYYIISGIFIILSIIDFALAAPVLVQEKHQASVDVVHKPKDLITVLWERGEGEESMKLVEGIRNVIKAALNKQVDSKSSVAQASSSAAPPGPDHGSTNVLQRPTPNPASSTANPDPILESSRSNPLFPILESSRPWAHTILKSLRLWNPASSKANPYPILESPRPSGPVRGDDEFNWPGNPNKRPLAGPDPDFDWDGPPPKKRPALSNEPGHAHEDEEEHVSGSFGSTPSSSSTESGFDGISYDEISQIMDHIATSPEHLGQAHQHQMGHLEQMNPGPSADPDFDRNYWMNVGDATPLRSAPPKPSNPGPSNPSLPTEPPSTGAESTDPELNPDDQAMDPQAAIYATKGKAKQLRRVSGTARDVGNAAQRELQPAERSLNPVE